METKWKQSGNNSGNKVETRVETKWKQSGNKVGTKQKQMAGGSVVVGRKLKPAGPKNAPQTRFATLDCFINGGGGARQPGTFGG